MAFIGKGVKRRRTGGWQDLVRVGEAQIGCRKGTFWRAKEQIVQSVGRAVPLVSCEHTGPGVCSSLLQ